MEDNVMLLAHQVPMFLWTYVRYAKMDVLLVQMT